MIREKPQSLYPFDLPRTTLADKADYILSWLATHPDIRIDSSTRIVNLCQTIQQSAGRTVLPGEGDYLPLAQSLKDIQEIWFIIQVLDEQLLQKRYRGRLTAAINNDETIPDLSATNNPGRDAQFEMLIAATAARAGLEVQAFGTKQADWDIRSNTSRWSLEAKRMTSSKKMAERVMKAAQQIEACGIGGIMALDTSFAMTPDRPVYEQFHSSEEVAEAHEKWSRDLHEKATPNLRKCIGSKPVGMVVFHDFLIQRGARRGDVERPWSLQGVWCPIHLTAAGSSQRARYNEFWTFFSAGLPNY